MLINQRLVYINCRIFLNSALELRWSESKADKSSETLKLKPAVYKRNFDNINKKLLLSFGFAFEVNVFKRATTLNLTRYYKVWL